MHLDFFHYLWYCDKKNKQTNRMRFSVALVKCPWFGINWHIFNQSECRNCCLYIIIQKIAPQAKSGKYFQILFFPRFEGKKWRRSEHAHASYPGLFFRQPGFSLYYGAGRKESSGTGLGLGVICNWRSLFNSKEINTRERSFHWPFKRI